METGLSTLVRLARRDPWQEEVEREFLRHLLTCRDVKTLAKVAVLIKPEFLLTRWRPVYAEWQRQWFTPPKEVDILWGLVPNPDTIAEKFPRLRTLLMEWAEGWWWNDSWTPYFLLANAWAMLWHHNGEVRSLIALHLNHSTMAVHRQIERDLEKCDDEI